MSNNLPVEKHDALLSELFSFVRGEQEAGNDKLLNIWQRPLTEKLEQGWSQAFVRLERCEEPQTFWACIGDSESRFREGDLLYLHAGSPLEKPLCRQLSFEREEDDRWLLRGNHAAAVWDEYAGGACYADPDAIDLTDYYERSLEDIATSQIGRDVVLPLLSGTNRGGYGRADAGAGTRTDYPVSGDGG